MVDKRALKILFDTYWSPKGWRSAGSPKWHPDTPPDSLQYAVRAGVMFPPKKCPHDEAVIKAHSLRRRIEPSVIGAAFAVGLGTNQPSLCSALGSYAVALHMPPHGYTSREGRSCVVCGSYDFTEAQDLNILSFERHKWGGVRHDDPVYIAFDLERFASEPVPAPTAGDRATLTNLLAIAGAMPPGAKLADLLRAIAPVVPGNNYQRRAIIGILGFAGVLPVPGRTGFFHSFTPATEREDTPWHKDDWPYPVRWWRGGFPVDTNAAAFWFGGSQRAA